MRIGRFNSMDPIWKPLQEPQDFNEYVYVQNNALNFCDPSGLSKQTMCSFGQIFKEIQRIEFVFVICAFKYFTFNCLKDAQSVRDCMISELQPTPQCCRDIEVSSILHTIYGIISPPAALSPHYGIRVTCYNSSGSPHRFWYDPWTKTRGVPSIYY